ncbi:MAG: hypothetical protein EOP06_29280 [Proteobacteria bacterium]|nr:MAG: hypothetical protein EOP06_29280 [Pseudomonadota bacterium]
MPIIYASLGTIERGSTFGDIALRSGLNEAEIHALLEKLEQLELVRAGDGRYFPILNHLAFDRLKQCGAFQRTYVDRLRAAILRAEKEFNSDHNLFLESTFSISKERMPEFKAELRELMCRFVEEREAPEGNTVASIACAFIPRSQL